jgi:hypothetical protein
VSLIAMSEPTASSGDAGADGGPDDAPPAERKIRRAIVQIRREGRKVAAIYATVDAALATLLANLAATLFGVPGLPTRLPIPDAILRGLAGAGLSLAEPTVSSAAVVGVAVGLVVFVAEVTWRLRRPLVEQFEAANPDLREALRTARDAVRDDRHSTMARRLYEGVLADLREASSVGLVDLRRVAATLLLVSLLSVATIQLAVVDLSVTGLGPSASPGGPDSGTQTEYAGLQDGSSILGEPEDVPEGQEQLDAAIDTSGSGRGNGTDAGSAAAYEDSGFDDSSTVESQRAGFSERERLDDAELIREYNLRIRQETDSDG